MSEIKQVTDWVDAAGQKPSTRNVANYLAYTMSELAEALRTLTEENCSDLDCLIEDMQDISRRMREGVYDDDVVVADRTELLDGAIDTAWCAIGLAHMLSDAKGAFNEIAASNFSKFENGVCALDSTGKVVKGPSYFKPDLAKFLRGDK